MLADHLGSIFWRQSYMAEIFLTLPPPFTDFFSDHGIETVIVTVATVAGTCLNYHLMYTSSKSIICLARLNNAFYRAGIRLLLIKAIGAVFLYRIIIFIFQALGDLEELNLIQLGIAADFGIFIGSLIEQPGSSQDDNLRQADQRLGGFNLYTFSFIANIIHIILKILTQLQDSSISKLDTQIMQKKAKLGRHITNILNTNSLDNIEQYIEIVISCHPKIYKQKNYKHKLNEIRSSSTQDRERRLSLSYLMIDIFDQDKIEDLIKNGSQSEIIQSIS